MAKLSVLTKEYRLPPKFQWKQAVWGAFYGLLGGTAFVLTASFIDVFLHPDLPLAVDWNLLRVRCFVIGPSLALIGTVTTMWSDTWPGLGSGALVTSLLALGSALFTSQSATGIRAMVLIFALLPVTVLSLPIVLLLRWLIKSHADSLSLKHPVARVMGLVLIVLFIAIVGGSFLKMPQRGLTATRYVNNLLQIGNNEKILAVEGVSQRENMPYQLYQSKSEVSVEGFDIRVEYEDGFVMICEVVLYPGRDPRLSRCQPSL